MHPPPSFSAAELAASPRWFAHLLDPVSDRVLLVEKSEEDYREASFLDDRALRPDRGRHVVEWRHLTSAFGPGLRRDARYIFHIGHVGSTLISRLLGELPGVLALREPLILRTFAERLAERDRPEALWDPDSLPQRLDALAALLSRSFRPEQRAMVKATSFTSEIAAELVPPGSKALLLYARPQRYFETILAGDNSRVEMAQTAPDRLRRLHRRLAEARWPLWRMREGEKVAMAWACEMGSLVQAAERLGDGAALWMDFDDFLADPAGSLRALAAFFDEPLDQAEASRLAIGPLMRRYSKAPEHEYGPELREQLLAQARREHSAALADAMRWLAAAGRDTPGVARCLDAAKAAG